ncbi:fibronectin type III domain-containing protein [Parapedobacter sp. 10938]|uniref:fibronectin type III domain-containing protein n=1 Tax=Parapedobacter flavus TaxID=3110225 RepID=UPI002DBA4810|nr:hypothetical protein [Parapedobacter sp. 10938]MEC3881308.1 hypothetical protein [Parapedobacter sp. 10938]
MNNYKMNLIRLTLAFVALTASMRVHGQEVQTNMLLPGPDGVVMTIGELFTYKQGETTGFFPSPEVKIEIYKTPQRGSSDQHVATVSFPASAAEMEEGMGQALKADLLKYLKAATMQQAYETLIKHGIDTLGPLIISDELQESLGLVYIDKTWQLGEKVTYYFDRIDGTGTQEKIYSESLDGTLPTYTTKFKLLTYNIFEDNASATWGTELPAGKHIPLYVQLYAAQTDEDFIVVDSIFTNQLSPDSVTVFYSNETVPDSHIAWYIRTVDRAGNLGIPSDTLNAINFDRNQIAPIENLQVTDTLDGLLVQWEPLPAKAYYTAIQVLKSRMLGEDYVVLDTIAPTETHFLDQQVIAGSNYFYKVRPLLADLPGVSPMLFSEASGYIAIPEGVAPSTPQGLQVAAHEGRIELGWLPNPELNIFGYYVLRGTSTDNLQVVAGPVKSHQYTDSAFSASYSGQYVYALQVMNSGQEMSDTSSVASVSIRQPVTLLAPGGMQASHQPEGIGLQWENTRTQDNTITGYILYRREKGSQSYHLVSATPIPLPAYVDSTAVPGKNYEYAVSSIDAWGNQSILSPYASTAADQAAYMHPPERISLRNLRAGIEVSWATPQEAGTRTYVIYRSTVKGDDFEKVATVNPSTPYVDENVQANVLYRYAVAIATDDSEGNKSKTYLIRRNEVER